MKTVDIYQTQRMVDSQSEAERAREARDGLADVLVRVSGNDQVLANPAVASSLSKPDQYLRQYSYQTITSPDGLLQSRLQLDFDAQSIDRLLRQAELPIWGSLRPELLVWLVIEDEQGRRFINDPEDPLLQALQQQAGLRGVPLVLPLYDLEDELSLSLTEAWGLFAEPLQQAGERYMADGMLAGRLYRDAAGEWQSRWRLFFADQHQAFNLVETELDQLGNTVMQYLGTTLASYYAVDTSTASRSVTELEVSGVNNFASYVQLTELLGRVIAIRKYELIGIEDDRLRFALDVDGSLDKLLLRLSEESSLISETSSNVLQPAGLLRMQWQG